MFADNDISFGAQRAKDGLIKLFEHVSNIGTWCINLNTGERRYSENMFRLMGFNNAPKEITDDAFLELIHPDDRQKVLSSFNDSVLQNIPTEVEFRIVFANGNVRNLHSQSQIISSEKGDRVVIGVTKDIGDYVSDPKGYDKRILYLEDVVESYPGILIAVDTDLRITLWNKKARDRFMRYREMVMGSFVFEAIPQFGHEYALQFLKQALDKGFPLEIELQDGNRSVPVAIHPILDKEDKVRGLIITDSL